MFDDLRDLDPPAAGEAEREAVRSRVGSLRARRRRRSLVIAGVAAVVAVTAVAVAATRPSTSVEVGAVGSTTTTSAPTPPDPIVAECFAPAVASDAALASGAVPVPNWPAASPVLVVLAGNGDLWVVHDGVATVWGHGYLWARAASDGTVYASRLADMEVDIDHLTGPGSVSATLRLPFTIKADAPAGSCPIDGYQATFAATSDGLVLTRHIAGPVPHSCPYSPDTSDPWRCQSREEVDLQHRATLDAQPDSSIGIGIGGPTRIVSDSTHSREFAFDAGDGPEFTIENGLGIGCCGTGALPGTAYALSPDGLTLASAYQGNILSMPHGPHYTTADTITALAWGSQYMAVAHGGRVTLVPLDGTPPVDLAGLAPGPIATIDWAS